MTFKPESHTLAHPPPSELPPAECSACAPLIALFADDALDALQAAAVAAHVRTCPSCALEVRQLRAILMGVRDVGERDRPHLGTKAWQQFEADVLAHVDALPARRRWQAPAPMRWAGGLALAAALVALAVTPVQHWLAGGPMQAEEQVDSRALLGSANEAVATDRAFVDDLAASDDDPLDMLDELEDLDDIDLDALGTALDDEAHNGQGA
ncbi:MAG: zf-HC2 domain-containing protein [Deltaproteobacteria bacterium]|nr:zf-HC2 domain-containing protein [Deltaproteobacteria bacterium]